MTCGTAVVTRRRECLNQLKTGPKEGKEDNCDGKNTEAQDQPCDMGPCPETKPTVGPVSATKPQGPNVIVAKNASSTQESEDETDFSLGE